MMLSVGYFKCYDILAGDRYRMEWKTLFDSERSGASDLLWTVIFGFSGQCIIYESAIRAINMRLYTEHS